MLSAWGSVSACFPSCGGVLRDPAVARATSGGGGSADPVVCTVSGGGLLAGGGGHAVELLSPGSLSATARRAPASPWSLGGLRCRWCCLGSAPPLSPGSGGDGHGPVLLRFFSFPSCEHGGAENGDFPSAMTQSADSKVSTAPGGSRGGGAAARLRSASVLAENRDPRDPDVISVFFGVSCSGWFG
jgi:hypothetical protein